MRWMTYREIGEQRGIDAASARRLATRNNWKRRPMDDGSGMVQALVPTDKLTAITRRRTTWRDEIAALRQQVERLAQRLDSQ
jgi:hypothetical protein